MYPYDLGVNLKTGELRRIPKDYIPVGYARIIKGCWCLNSRIRNLVDHNHLNNSLKVYKEDGELRNQWWSIPRWLEDEYKKSSKG